MSSCPPSASTPSTQALCQGGSSPPMPALINAPSSLHCCSGVRSAADPRVGGVGDQLADHFDRLGGGGDAAMTQQGEDRLSRALVTDRAAQASFAPWRGHRLARKL